MQESGNGAERNLDVLIGVQLDSQNDASGGHHCRSFTATVELCQCDANDGRQLVALPAIDNSRMAYVIAMQIASLTSPLVGKRPNRIEPRAVKRRPKPMHLLNMTQYAVRETSQRHRPVPEEKVANELFDKVARFARSKRTCFGCA